MTPRTRIHALAARLADSRVRELEAEVAELQTDLAWRERDLEKTVTDLRGFAALADRLRAENEELRRKLEAERSQRVSCWIVVDGNAEVRATIVWPQAGPEVAV